MTHHLIPMGGATRIDFQSKDGGACCCTVSRCTRTSCVLALPAAQRPVCQPSHPASVRATPPRSLGKQTAFLCLPRWVLKEWSRWLQCIWSWRCGVASMAVVDRSNVGRQSERSGRARSVVGRHFKLRASVVSHDILRSSHMSSTPTNKHPTR